jgi:Uma2 family endonuclease
MTAIKSLPGQTVEDYLALADSRGWELDDGLLVEKPVGTQSSWVSSYLHILIGFFLREHPMGLVFHADTAYQCFPDYPSRVRKPDVSFIRHGRLSPTEFSEPFIRIPPDLAAEVVSPNDGFMEVDRKVRQYLDAGVRLVWVVNPDLRTVAIHHPASPVTIVDEHGRVSGEDVLPGFSFAVAELFPQPMPA